MRKVKVKVLRKEFEEILFKDLPSTAPVRDKKHPVYRFMWKRFKKRRRVA